MVDLATDKAVFQYLLSQVLSVSPDSPTILALNRAGVNTVTALNGLTDEFFDEIVSVHPHPRLGELSKLKLLVRYATKLQQDNGNIPIAMKAWMAITRDDF